MTRRRAGVLLWAGAVLLLPLPYVIVGDGAVPVLRIAMLASISTGYAAFVDGSGKAWLLAIILAAQTLAFSAMLGGVAALLAWIIPHRVRRTGVLVILAVAFAVALLFPIYRTPFDDMFARATWLGLFQ